MIILFFSIISLITYSCNENEAINYIKSGDANISTPTNTFSVDNNGNINFKCYVTNTSNSDNPDLTGNVNFFYSSTGFDVGYSHYSSMDGNLTGTMPGDKSWDSMIMPVLQSGCCNQCCPGYYMCIIEGRSSDNSLIDSHSVQVHIDHSGNMNIKQ